MRDIQAFIEEKVARVQNFFIPEKARALSDEEIFLLTEMIFSPRNTLPETLHEMIRRDVSIARQKYGNDWKEKLRTDVTDPDLSRLIGRFLKYVSVLKEMYPNTLDALREFGRPAIQLFNKEEKDRLALFYSEQNLIKTMRSHFSVNVRPQHDWSPQNTESGYLLFPNLLFPHNMDKLSPEGKLVAQCLFHNADIAVLEEDFRKARDRHDLKQNILDDILAGACQYKLSEQSLLRFLEAVDNGFYDFKNSIDKIADERMLTAIFSHQKIHPENLLEPGNEERKDIYFELAKQTLDSLKLWHFNTLFSYVVEMTQKNISPVSDFPAEAFSDILPEQFVNSIAKNWKIAQDGTPVLPDVMDEIGCSDMNNVNDSFARIVSSPMNAERIQNELRVLNALRIRQDYQHRLNDTENTSPCL